MRLWIFFVSEPASLRFEKSLVSYHNVPKLLTENLLRLRALQLNRIPGLYRATRENDLGTKPFRQAFLVSMSHQRPSFQR